MPPSNGAPTQHICATETVSQNGFRLTLEIAVEMVHSKIAYDQQAHQQEHLSRVSKTSINVHLTDQGKCHLSNLPR